MPSEIKGSSNFDSDSAGKVLQVVEGFTSGGGAYINSTSPVATALTASITPTSTSSKVLVMVSASVGSDDSDENYLIASIFRNGTTNIRSSTILRDSSGGPEESSVTLNKLDSPNTTSAVTYTMYGHASTASLDFRPNYRNTNSSIILMEIGA